MSRNAESLPSRNNLSNRSIKIRETISSTKKPESAPIVGIPLRSVKKDSVIDVHPRVGIHYEDTAPSYAGLTRVPRGVFGRLATGTPTASMKEKRVEAKRQENSMEQ